MSDYLTALALRLRVRRIFAELAGVAPDEVPPIGMIDANAVEFVRDHDGDIDLAAQHLVEAILDDFHRTHDGED